MPDEKRPPHSGFSRRYFLKGSALATAGATVMGAAAVLIDQSAKASGALSVEGPGYVPITLQINGAARTLQVEPRMTLVDALRGTLGLTGTKIACDRGACSACTVWVDGMTVSSCMLLAIDVGMRRVTTIEGMMKGTQLHSVQAAFIEHDAMQCGFCTPGMVMSCAALLHHTPRPTAAEVETAISGHICRCGTYPHVVAATLAAAKTYQA